MSYRMDWWRTGYGLRMGSADVCPPPGGDFVRVYHMTKADSAISILKQRHLNLSMISNLNDPFELMALSHSKTIALRERFAATHGLLSFSADWTNPVLWSHYAEQHKGVCLGFDLPRKDAKIVNYQYERDDSKHWSDAELQAPSEDLLSYLLTTKFLHWQYEREIRMVVPFEQAKTNEEDGKHYVVLDEQLVLSEVIIGVSCMNSARAEIENILYGHYGDVYLTCARVADKFFNIVPREFIRLPPRPKRT